MRIYLALLLALAALGGLCIGLAILPLTAMPYKSFCTSYVGKVWLPNGTAISDLYYGPTTVEPYPPGKLVLEPSRLSDFNVTLVLNYGKPVAVVVWHSYDSVEIELKTWNRLEIFSTVPVCVKVVAYRDIDPYLLSLGMALLVASIALRVGMGYALRRSS